MAKTVREIISECLNNEGKELEFVQELFEILRQFDGKQISARIATKVKEHYDKLYPNEVPVVTLEKKSSYWSLLIWGGFTGTKYDNKYDLLVGYFNEPFFSSERFVSNNGRWFKGAIERQETRKIELASSYPEDVENAITEYNHAKKKLCDLLNLSCDSYLIREKCDATRL